MSLAATLFVKLINPFRGSPLSQFGTLPILPLLAFQGDYRNAIPRVPGFRRTRMVPHVGGFPYSLCYFTILTATKVARITFPPRSKDARRDLVSQVYRVYWRAILRQPVALLMHRLALVKINPFAFPLGSKLSNSSPKDQFRLHQNLCIAVDKALESPI